MSDRDFILFAVLGLTAFFFVRGAWQHAQQTRRVRRAWQRVARRRGWVWKKGGFWQGIRDQLFVPREPAVHITWSYATKHEPAWTRFHCETDLVGFIEIWPRASYALSGNVSTASAEYDEQFHLASTEPRRLRAMLDSEWRALHSKEPVRFYLELGRLTMAVARVVSDEEEFFRLLALLDEFRSRLVEHTPGHSRSTGPLMRTSRGPVKRSV